MPTVYEVVRCIEAFAPPALQEDYDNSGLLVGEGTEEVKGVLLSLDCTEAVIEEAIKQGCNLVIAHHPIVFKGLKRLTGSNYVERTVLLAIRHRVAIYACHTNLDNVWQGVNALLADKLELTTDRKILRPVSHQLLKLVTFIPSTQAEKVTDALFKAGAGQIGDYSECAFSGPGIGSFKPGIDTKPFIGEPLKRELVEETRVEVILPDFQKDSVLRALFQAHPYEEVAYDLFRLENKWAQTGSGLVGLLPHPIGEKDLLEKIGRIFRLKAIKHTPLLGKKVQKIAICGGSGSFLIKDAIKSGADVFITADVKYHEFFDADGKMVILDIGHFESEQFTPEIFYSIISEKFSTFAVRLSKTDTNPVNYFIA